MRQKFLNYQWDLKTKKPHSRVKTIGLPSQKNKIKVLQLIFNNASVNLRNMEKPWCMCVKLKEVARDGYSACSICRGKDAYGTSKERPKNKLKSIEGIIK